MPILPPSLGQTRGAQPIAQPGAAPQPAIQGTGMPPGDDMDEELQQRLMRMLSPMPPGVDAEIMPGMRTAPPTSPEEKAQREQGFRAMFDRLAQDPNAQQALLMAAAQIARPIDPASGETVLNRLIQGAATGTMTYDEMQGQDRAAEREEERLQLEKDRVDLSREQLELSKINTEERLNIARERLGISKAELDLAAQRLTRQDRKVGLQEKKLALQIETLKRDESVQEGQKLLGRAFVEAAKNDPSLQMTESQAAQLDVLAATDIEEASDFVNTLRGGTQDEDQRDRKIQDRFLALKYLNEQNDGNTSDPELMRLATGLVDESILPQETDFGIRLVDTEKGALGMEGAISSPRAARESPDRRPPALSETAVAAAEEGTGLLSGVLAATAMLPLREDITDAEEEAVQSRTRLRNINNNLIDSLRLNNRSQAEVERIKNQLSPLEPGLFRPTPTSRAQQKSVDQFMADEIRKLQRDVQDPALSSKKREELQNSIQAFESARDSLGIRQFESVLATLKENPESLADQLTPEDARAVVQILTDDEIKNLPLGAKKVLDQIISGQ